MAGPHRQTVRDGTHRDHRPRVPHDWSAAVRRTLQDHPLGQGQQRAQGIQHQVLKGRSIVSRKKAVNPFLLVPEIHVSWAGVYGKCML